MLIAHTGICAASVRLFMYLYLCLYLCHTHRGKVTVTPTDPAFGEAVTIEAGDVATFPAGMSCTWDVTEAISKHYNFE
jgi:uncharacterized protein